MGGLGFQRFQDINSALLAKLGWKIAFGVDTLWTRMMQAKYLKSKSLFTYKKPKGTFMVWQGILSSRNFVQKRAYFQIGNGLLIDLWKDLWIEGLPNRTLVLKAGVDTRQWSKVIDMRVVDDSAWNEEVLRSLCSNKFVEAILKIPWPTCNEEDRLFWRGNSRGIFTVSDYFDMDNGATCTNSSLRTRIWKSKLHERLKMFLWKILTNVFPTRDVLSSKFRLGEVSCVVCEDEDKTIMHLFKECPGFRAMDFACKWEGKVDIWNYVSVLDMVELCLNPIGFVHGGDMNKEQFTSFFTCLLFGF